MKHTFKINLALACIAGLFLASCEDETTPAEQDALNYEYSEITVEQSKKDVEDAGIQLVNEFKALENEEAMDVMTEMMNLMSSESEVSSGLNIPLQAAKIIKSEGNKTEVFKLLKSVSEERIALLDSFKMHVAGTYTYDFEKEDFTKTENTDALVIKFPGKSTDTENTAEIFVGNLTVKDITSPHKEVASEVSSIQLPTGLDATLKYNGKALISFKLEAEYLPEGIPTKLYNTLTIGTFVFSHQLDHDPYSKASFKFDLSRNENTLIAFGAEANGNWSEQNIDANTFEKSDTYTYKDEQYNESTQKWEEVEVTHTDTWTETDFEEIINEGNAFMQFMTLKAVGKANIKAIVDGEQAFDEAHKNDRDEWGDYPENIEKEKSEKTVELVKENAKFVLVYTKDNSLIAALEPYSKPYIDEYYNGDGTYGTHTGYDVDFKMIFKDNSPVSMETFVKSELSGFFDELNSFIRKINQDHGTEFGDIDPDGEDSTQQEY